MPCGRGTHAFRWEAGSLRLPEHPDAEGELALAALGGEKARCIELAQAWGRHTEDLSVLAIGPRGPADQIPVSWDDVRFGGAGRSAGAAGPSGSPRRGRLGWQAAGRPPAAGQPAAGGRRRADRPAAAGTG